MLTAADLANGSNWTTVLLGAMLWPVYMGRTQGLLARMVAHTAPVYLRGTAFGFFNLLSGIAMLAANITAGLIWDNLGAAATFYSGAVASLVTLGLLAVLGRTLKRPK